MWRDRAFWRWTACGAAVAMVGCLLPDLSPLEGGAVADAAVDGGTPDAPTTDGEAGPPTNSCGALLFGKQLVADDLENGCSAWGGYQATVEPITTASSGGFACKVCRSSAGPDGFFASRSVAASAAPGSSVELVACARSATDAGTAVRVELPERSGTDVNVTSTFQPLRVGQSAADGGSYALIVRDYSDTPGTCFIFDDVRLLQTN